MSLTGFLTGILRPSPLYESRPKRTYYKPKTQFATKPDRAAEAVLDLVCDAYSVTMEDVCSMKRPAPVAHARQVAYYVLRSHYGYTYAEIGKQLGGRDHSSVHHGVTKMTRMIAVDPSVKEEVDWVIGELASC